MNDKQINEYINKLLKYQLGPSDKYIATSEFQIEEKSKEKSLQMLQNVTI